MRTWATTAGLALALAGFAAGQDPLTDPTTSPSAAVPSTATSAGAVPTTAAAPASASGGKNIFSFFCPTADQLASCKAKLCSCAPLQLFGQMLAPVSALTGGLVGTGCSGPSAAALAQPATSAQGAAARIQQEEAGASARRASIRYLASANCQYYPEAEAALIASLRGDPVECVRIEAARAFVTGCCCTKKTIAALTLAVNGKTTDSFPSEKSECVKALAFLALQKCLATYVDIKPAAPPEPAPAPKKAPAAATAKLVGPTPYYDQAAAGPINPLVIGGRHAVARGMNVSRATMRQITGRADLTSLVVEAVVAPAEPVIAADSYPTTPPEVAAIPQKSKDGSLLGLIRASFDD